MKSKILKQIAKYGAGGLIGGALMGFLSPVRSGSEGDWLLIMSHVLYGAVVGCAAGLGLAIVLLAIAFASNKGEIKP